MPEAVWFKLCDPIMLFQSFIKIPVVDPVNSFEGNELDSLEGAPRSAPMDEFRLE